MSGYVTASIRVAFGTEDMAAVETPSNKNSPPFLWKQLLGWTQGIPRAAILSLVGPGILLLVGYLGWRYYGAKTLDGVFYAVKPESIHVTNTPPWLKTDIVKEVFEGSNLGKMSLLDDQTAAVIARAFDAHPWIRKTYRVQKMAGGQILVNVEYRTPIAMVHCEIDDKDGVVRGVGAHDLSHPSWRVTMGPWPVTVHSPLSLFFLSAHLSSLPPAVHRPHRTPVNRDA